MISPDRNDVVRIPRRYSISYLRQRSNEQPI